MKYSRLGYFIGEGFRNVFKNKKSTGASLVIMCATMIIFGMFLVLGENINHIVKVVEDTQGMQVYFEKDMEESEIIEAGEKIRNLEINGVKVVNSIERRTKEDALNSMKEKLKNNPVLLEGMDGENNIFPESYIVKLTDLNLSQQVKEEIEKMDNIKEILIKDKTIERVINLAKLVKIGTGVILVLLIFISVFIIANTIKLTVHARRKEISIMKYVGATNNFIRWPFIVEGMIIGIFASAISILIIGVAYNALADYLVNTRFMALINMSLLPFADMFNNILITYMGLGIGIGILGSIISMRKYLKV